MEMIPLGSTVRDVISGFTGIALYRVIRPNGNVRVSVSPRAAEDNKIPDGYDIDAHVLEVMDNGVRDLAQDIPGSNIGLLDVVEDQISGFVGTVIERVEHLTGCLEFTVQDRIDETSLLQSSQILRFDHNRLRVIEKASREPAAPVKKGSARTKSVR